MAQISNTPINNPITATARQFLTNKQMNDAINTSNIKYLAAKSTSPHVRKSG
jgi:hypothetical protein